MKKVFLETVAIFCMLTACENYKNYRGNNSINDNFDNFVVGKTTMQDVIRTCGTPSLHKDDFTWIYTGYEEETAAFSDIKLNNTKFVRMTFDVNRVLIAKEKILPLNAEECIMDDEYTPLTSNDCSAGSARTTSLAAPVYNNVN